MADSALTLDYQAMAEAIGHYLGYQRKTYTNYVSGQLADIHDCLDSGYRRFLRSRKWRFTRQHTTLNIWPDASGTMAAGAPTYDGATYTTWTAAASVFYPSMVGKTIVLSTAGSLTIAVYVSATQIKVAGDYSAQAGSQTFTIDSDNRFDLPDDFDSMNGVFTFPVDANIRSCKHINEEEFRKYMSGTDSTGVPFAFAIRRKSNWAGTTGPRQEVVFYYPTDTVYLMSYSYNIFVPYQIRNATSYAVAGMMHTQTILDLALAHAERRYKKVAEGLEETAAKESLALSFAQDDELAADSVGGQVDRSDDIGTGLSEPIPTVLFNGVEP